MLLWWGTPARDGGSYCQAGVTIRATKATNRNDNDDARAGRGAGTAGSAEGGGCLLRAARLTWPRRPYPTVFGGRSCPAFPIPPRPVWHSCTRPMAGKRLCVPHPGCRLVGWSCPGWTTRLAARSGRTPSAGRASRRSPGARRGSIADVCLVRVAVVLAGRLGAALAVGLEHDTENDTCQRLTGLLSGHPGARHWYCDGPGGPLLCGVDRREVIRDASAELG
jgi:hypothetical protein